MTDELLIQRLSNLYRFLEDEGWYTKANTAAYASARLQELLDLYNEQTNQLDSARHSITVLETRVAKLLARNTND